MKIRCPYWFDWLDRRLVETMAAHGLRLLRLALGIVFLWFGSLKLFPGVSPAETLAGRTIETLTFGTVPTQVAVPILAVWEIAIGAGMLAGRWMRVVLILLVMQMLGTMMPFVLFPDEMFAMFPLVPTLEGQYIIKNIVIVSAAIVLGATLRGGELSPEPVVETRPTCPEPAAARDGVAARRWRASSRTVDRGPARPATGDSGLPSTRGRELHASRPQRLPRTTTEPSVAMMRLTLADASVVRRRWAAWKPWAVSGGGAALAGLGMLLERHARATHDDRGKGPGRSRPDIPCARAKWPDSISDAWRRAEIERALGVSTLVVGGAVAVTGLTLVILNRRPNILSTAELGARA